MKDPTNPSQSSRGEKRVAAEGDDSLKSSAKDKVPPAKGSENAGEPSLGPACLVVAILFLAAFAAVCGIGSWFVFSDQYPYAEKGITKQLIPWVQTSQLAEEDKRSITNQLNDLIPLLQAREIDKRQLTRLHYCLQDNPVLLWGGVQSILLQAQDSELSQTERSALERISQRLLWLATDRKLGRRDLEFTLQNCSQVREDGASIEVKRDLSADQIRDFMSRAEQLVESFEVPNEPYDKSPAEAFAILIDKALHGEE